MIGRICLLAITSAICITQAIGQISTLTVKPYGIQFKDGSNQNTAIPSSNNGSEYAWFVYVSYTNGIAGSVTEPGFEDNSKVLKVHHEVSQDLNSNGIPNGVKHHRAFLLTKEIDSASPDLYQVYDNNLTIDSLTIKYYRENQSGLLAEQFRITLFNVKIKEVFTHLGYDQSSASFQGEESLMLIYQSIEVRHYSPNGSHTLAYDY